MNKISNNLTTGGKFIWYILICMLASVLFLICLNLLAKLSSGLILLYIPGIALFCSLISVGIFYAKFKDVFTSFAMFTSVFSGTMLIFLLSPFVVERSLSSFIYFEAYENGYITKSSINADYLDDFVQKRFDDGVKGGFLRQVDDDKYETTTKGAVFYYINHSLGVLTDVLDNYEKFTNRQKDN